MSADQVVHIAADTVVVSGDLERIIEDIKQQASEQGDDRTCASVGCDTKLSRYNKTNVCSIHTTDPTRAPRPW